MLYERLFKNMPLKQVFYRTSVISAFGPFFDIALVQRWNVAVGVNDHVFGGVSALLQGVVSNLSEIFIFTLISKICPENIEATLFSWVMGVLMTAAVISSSLGGAFTEAVDITQTNYSSLDQLLWVQVAISFASLVLVKMVPTDGRIERAVHRMKAELVLEENDSSLTLMVHQQISTK